jgi:hypothetical protein
MMMNSSPSSENSSVSREAIGKVDPELAIKSYMREKGQEHIDVIDCSAQLNLPVDQVEQAYIKLLSINAKTQVSRKQQTRIRGDT